MSIGFGVAPGTKSYVSQASQEEQVLVALAELNVVLMALEVDAKEVKLWEVFDIDEDTGELVIMELVSREVWVFDCWSCVAD